MWVCGVEGKMILGARGKEREKDGERERVK